MRECCQAQLYDSSTRESSSAADRSICDSRRRALPGERFFRAYHAELVSLGVGRGAQDSAPVCPMSTRRAPSARSRSISCSRSCALLVRSRCTRFLTVFGSVTGMKHMPTGAFSSVPMTISRSRSETTFQPGACVQNRASPGSRERQRRCDGVGQAWCQYALARRTASREPACFCRAPRM